MKKVWSKPTITSYKEDELLEKMVVKAQSGAIHEDFSDASHTDFDDIASL